MKKIFSMKGLVLSGLCGLLLGGTTLAQQPSASATAPAAAPAAARPSVPVVVVDVDLLMRNHPKLAESQSATRAEAAAFEPVVRKEQAELDAMRQELATLNPGSEEYVQKDAAFQTKLAAFRQEVELKSRDLDRRQLLQVYQVYCEIQTAVTQFCQQYNVDLALVSSSSKLLPADPQNPIDAKVAMSRSAIYAKTTHDITDAVAKMLNIPLQVQSPSMAMGARSATPGTATAAAQPATQPAAQPAAAPAARTAAQPTAARR